MSIIQRTSGQGCPCCASRKIIPGFNDLQTLCPDLMREWDWIANNNAGIYPDRIAKSSSVKANWKCSVCHGSFTMRIANRTSGKQGCPYCAGQKILKGYNDLQSCYTELIASEWDWIENGKKGIKPDELAKYSNLKANWICSKCSYKWKARISDRTLKESGCPKCSRRISNQEKQVADFMNDYLCSHYDNMTYTMLRSIKFNGIYDNLGIDAENALRDGLQSHLFKELDIYIPELNFAVEYDGDYWHDDSVMLSQRGMTNDKAHEIKHELCRQAGIDLIFVTEHDWLNDSESVKSNLASIIDKHIV